jgi:hypothetical protein
MTRENFSSGFDTLLNSYISAADFGRTDNPSTIELDEYEKSVFLTNAQEDVALGLYTGKNTYGESFEQTEELRRYLSNLINEAVLSPITTSNGMPLGVDSKSKFFTLPDNLWFITYEAIAVEGGECKQGFSMMVVPVRQDEYQRLKKNPFRGANDRRALRLDLSENNIEVVSKYPITQYYVRYLRKLNPIVLADFTNEGVSVNGVNTPTECELHESLHQKILERAVILALQSKGYTRNNENK